MSVPNPHRNGDQPKQSDTQMKLKKAVYSGHTLVGPWDDKRMDRKFQNDYRMKKLYSLPGKSAETFTTTNSGYGAFAAREMIDSNTKIRNIDTYKRDDLPPLEEYYKSSSRSAHDHPAKMPMPEFIPTFDFGFVPEYQRTWSKTDPYMKRWEGKNSCFDIALGRPDGFDPDSEEVKARNRAQ
mmetsp:Transcript_9665/g.23797  ORF Transcript_9665/g.23797 Transcript_9665/m.23797 type:complete len:182 (+) Transcript_9665:69-614(+)|eukprot:CAMPEP_0178999470 /NCGR_PEP_ID=MMETSP0795-20121207/10086_1 /TAXON_ID=88552 /ORGANISM="Amoebophrya sp., Strain Ameob2" /LENGTH=181 /DNA_ID=CAMNT_0020692263 /DNA_START=48 /DNA_END=593 /DNA_ORIENTATION=+